MSAFVQVGYPSLIAIELLAALAGYLAVRRGSQSSSGTRVGLVPVMATLAVWIARWIEVGHFPLFGTYENALSAAVAVTLVGTLVDLRRRVVIAGPPSFLVAALLLAQGIRYDPMPYSLTISERSLVVDVHAVLAWMAFGVLTAAFAVALRVAVARDATSSETLLDRLLHAGFVLHTSMIVSGSFYKFLLFGKVWSWDPIETMALIAWLSYGTLLHLSLLAGWSGRRLARWTIATFVVLAVSYRAIIYFPSFATYHVFDIALKLHR